MAKGPSGLALSLVEGFFHNPEPQAQAEWQGCHMSEGALVTTRSVVAIWNHVLFVEWCMEAATVLNRLVDFLAPITLRFEGDNERSNVRAEIACHNRVFAVMTPVEAVEGSTSPHPLLVLIARHSISSRQIASSKKEVVELLKKYLLEKSYEIELKGGVVYELFKAKVHKEG